MFVDPVDAVFVQPHFDDVALSCGGTVAACAAVGSVLIVTVFAGRSSGTPGSFAQFQHERWGLDDEQVVAYRQAEDRCAAAALGATVRTLWLDFEDAIYRDEGYSSDEALFGRPLVGDQGLVDEVAAALTGLGARMVLPLAIGNHVDHQIVFQTGRILSETGTVVRYYADLPYALDEIAYRERLVSVGNPDPSARSISEEEFEARWNAVQCYKTQLPVLFRNLDDPKERFRRFGGASFDRQPVELFWSLDQIEEQKR